jgi:hypothetical protein
MKNYQFIKKDCDLWSDFQFQNFGRLSIFAQSGNIFFYGLKSEMSVSSLCVGGDVDYWAVRYVTSYICVCTSGHTGIICLAFLIGTHSQHGNTIRMVIRYRTV